LANVRLILSRQNCIRSAPTVGLETRSGMRANSMFNARIDKYASRVEGAMKVWRIYDEESNFLDFLISYFRTRFESAKTNCKRLEQYDLAAATSPSVSVAELRAGVLYGVVA
jgi:hypothetical protein